MVKSDSAGLGLQPATTDQVAVGLQVLVGPGGVRARRDPVGPTLDRRRRPSTARRPNGRSPPHSLRGAGPPRCSVLPQPPHDRRWRGATASRRPDRLGPPLPVGVGMKVGRSRAGLSQFASTSPTRSSTGRRATRITAAPLATAATATPQAVRPPPTTSTRSPPRRRPRSGWGSTPPRQPGGHLIQTALPAAQEARVVPVMRLTDNVYLPVLCSGEVGSPGVTATR